jgi:acyl carrier protein
MKSELDILSELQPVFDDVFGDESVQLSGDTTSDDIASWDSVAHVSLIIAAETQFGIMFDPDEIMAMENVGVLVSTIQSKLADA